MEVNNKIMKIKIKSKSKLMIMKSAIGGELLGYLK